MAILNIENVRISGFAACVPKESEEVKDLDIFETPEAAKNFMVSAGIQRRRKASDKTTSADLCLEAAKKLILEIQWDLHEIDLLIFVTTTPDYLVPPTSCILQDKLGLSTDCLTLQISHGCPGWVHGLSVAGSLLAQHGLKKGLLLTGDTPLKVSSPLDKTTYPLFGDAGTATAIEYKEDATGLKFHFGTNGASHQSIIIPDGGFRNQTTSSSLEYIKYDEGIVRNNLQQVLSGMDVFSFGISVPPQSIETLLKHFKINQDDIDYFLLHQANLFMNERIRKKMKIHGDKVPYSLTNYANTASASIPLTIVTNLQSQLRSDKIRFIANAFGIGLSWGSVYFETDKIVCCDLVEI